MKKFKRVLAIGLISLSLSFAIGASISAACAECSGPGFEFADPDHVCA